MKRIALVLALLLAGMSTLPATAGDAAVWRYNRHSAEPPFPLSGRSESVWASGACWSECGVLYRLEPGRVPRTRPAGPLPQTHRRRRPRLPARMPHAWRAVAADRHAVSARFLARKLEFRASNPSLDIRPEPRRATGSVSGRARTDERRVWRMIGLRSSRVPPNPGARSVVAEGVRFELTSTLAGMPVFKTGALNRSATLPSHYRPMHIPMVEALRPCKPAIIWAIPVMPRDRQMWQWNQLFTTPRTGGSPNGRRRVN